jgi:hypothetical protein
MESVPEAACGSFRCHAFTAASSIAVTCAQCAPRNGTIGSGAGRRLRGHRAGRPAVDGDLEREVIAVDQAATEVAGDDHSTGPGRLGQSRRKGPGQPGTMAGAEPGPARTRAEATACHMSWEYTTSRAAVALRHGDPPSL